MWFWEKEYTLVQSFLGKEVPPPAGNLLKEVPPPGRAFEEVVEKEHVWVVKLFGRSLPVI